MSESESEDVALGFEDSDDERGPAHANARARGVSSPPGTRPRPELEWARTAVPPFGKGAEDGDMVFLMHGGLHSQTAGPTPTCMYSQKVGDFRRKFGDAAQLSTVSRAPFYPTRHT
jgi:hypothetical protein